MITKTKCTRHCMRQGERDVMALYRMCLEQKVRAGCRTLFAAAGNAYAPERIRVAAGGEKRVLGDFYTNAPALLAKALGVSPQEAGYCLLRTLAIDGECFRAAQTQHAKLLSFWLSDASIANAARRFLCAAEPIVSEGGSVFELAAKRAQHLSGGRCDTPEFHEEAQTVLRRILDTPRKAALGGSIGALQAQWLVDQVEAWSIKRNPEVSQSDRDTAGFMLGMLACALVYFL